MTYARCRSRKSHRTYCGSESTFASSDEALLFVHAWCDAVTKLSRHQMGDLGKELLDVWYDSVGGPDHRLEDQVDFDRLVTSKYPPLLEDLARRHRPDRKPKAVPLDRRISWLAKTLGLDDVEQAILAVLARCAVHEEWDRLLRVLPGKGHNPSPRRIALVIGYRAAQIEDRLATGARLWRTGLVNNDNDGEYSANNLLVRVARSSSPPSRLARQLMPVAAKSSLDWQDFDHIGPLRDIAQTLVASETPTAILLFGPPGTGKTEFARLLAARSGKRAVFAGTDDGSGYEPNRRERLAHLTVIRALTRCDPTRLVVMDEADDILLLGAQEDRGGRSKLFLNRLIEEGEQTTIWIVNEPRMLEESLVRRMGIAIEFPKPPLYVRRRVVERHARKTRLRLSHGEMARLAELPVAPALIGNAIRGAKQSGGGADAAMAIGEGLVTAIRGFIPGAVSLPRVYDPELSVADLNLADLANRLVDAPSRQWSLLLSGHSGTGKSAYAHYLADRLQIELIEKRGSDLFGMFVGETEARIANAFREAARSGAMLLIDEADDFLSDRRDAVQGCERSMVNEMLRQMEVLKAPFVATTNLADRLDPATQRRFTTTVTFRALDHAKAAQQFHRWFGADLPIDARLVGQTPGDFALVAKRAQLLGEDDPRCLLAWLRAEAEMRGEGKGRMGFAS